VDAILSGQCRLQLGEEEEEEEEEEIYLKKT
jgi:hypothetical protein